MPDTDESERNRAVEIARIVLANIRYVMYGSAPLAWPTPEETVILARQFLISQDMSPDKE